MATTYADANDFRAYWGVEIENKYEAHVNRFLVMAASNIQAALAASGAINCSLASWATEYLKNMNVILAGILYQDLCTPHLTVDEKRLYMEYANGQLEQIRTGKLELCAGETGSDYPAIDWAEQSTDEFSAAKIIIKEL